MSSSENRTPARSLTIDNKVYQIDDIDDSTKSLINECLAAENNSKNKQLEAHFAKIAHQILVEKVKTSLQDIKFENAEEQDD